MSAVHVDAALAFLTYQQAAEALDVPTSTIRRWVHEQRLPAVRLGTRVWLPEREVVELEHQMRRHRRAKTRDA